MRWENLVQGSIRPIGMLCLGYSRSLVMSFDANGEEGEGGTDANGKHERGSKPCWERADEQ